MQHWVDRRGFHWSWFWSDCRGRVCGPFRFVDFAGLPLHTSAQRGRDFLRKAISYSLIVACILFHDYYSPRNINLGIRIFHNLSAILCFAFVVYLIQRYMAQREALAKTVKQQRDDLLEDVKLAGQVQRLFLPSGKQRLLDWI